MTLSRDMEETIYIKFNELLESTEFLIIEIQDNVKTLPDAVEALEQDIRELRSFITGYIKGREDK